MTFPLEYRQAQSEILKLKYFLEKFELLPEALLDDERCQHQTE